MYILSLAIFDVLTDMKYLQKPLTTISQRLKVEAMLQDFPLHLLQIFPMSAN